MIVYKSLFNPFKLILTTISPIKLTNKIPIFQFCQSSPNPTPNLNPDNNSLLSQQLLKKFQSLLYQNTEQSLQQGAQLLANLQLAVQHNQQILKQYQSNLQTCPAITKSLIQKMQIVIDNIKQQQQQNNSIEKRTQKELSDCKNFSISTIARQVLDIADSLSRCKKISIQHHRNQDHQVVVAINKADKQIKSIFQRYGIKQFDPTGQQYDPNLQQALSTTPSPNPELKNKIAYTSRTGYMIKGRLLRSAHVGIYL